MITKLDKEGIDFIAKAEGIRLKSYKCTAGIWTIGIGSTYYEDGSRVKEGQIISLDRALQLFNLTIDGYEKAVNSYTRDDINQHQFNALVSFAYNLGNNALKGSGLLKKVNINPNDITITKEFQKWVNSGGKITPGLVTRRNAEALMYFKK